MPRLAASLVALLLLASRAPAADPLDYVPPTAQIVAVVDDPRKLADAVTGLDAFKRVQTLAPVKALYDTAQVRRALQLLVFAEFGLGAKWPELLDRLAGNGAAVAGRLDGGGNAPALVVLCGKDEKLAEKAFTIGLKVIEDELARQGVKVTVTRKTVNGIDTATVADSLHLARTGAVTLLSNKPEAIKAAIEQATAEQTKPRIHPARKAALGLIPKSPLAWVWVDLSSVKQSKAAKDYFDSTRQDFIQTMAFGTVVDSVRRSDFLAVGLYQEKTGFRLSLRLPAGRDGMWDQLALHVPPRGTPGTLPPLEPPGTVYSHSLYLDIAYLWKNRDTLLNAEIRMGLEEGEKQISKVLPSNVKLGQLLEMWGPHHRVVVANHDVRPYKTEPGLKLPAFGYVATARDKKFAPSLDPVLRSAGLIGTLTYGLKMTEHEHEGVTLVAYRFPENKPLADDPDGIRYNLEPCFAVVGDDLVLATTVELGKKIITELKKPQTEKPSPAVLRGRLSAKGAAQALEGFMDPLVTDAVLTRGVGLAEARKEIADVVAFVKTLGTLRAEIDVTDKEYRADLVWEHSKK